MNEYKYHYLYTTLDIDAFDLDDFKYNFVNITAFRLVDVDDIGVREIIKDMRRFQQKQHQKQPNQSSTELNQKPSKFIGVRFVFSTPLTHLCLLSSQSFRLNSILFSVRVRCAVAGRAKGVFRSLILWLCRTWSIEENDLTKAYSWARHMHRDMLRQKRWNIGRVATHICRCQQIFKRVFRRPLVLTVKTLM